MEAAINEVSQVLKDNNQSVTKPRLIVFSYLYHHEAVSMTQLVNDLRSEVDRASIYRCITLYESLGIIDRVQIGWKYKIELSERFAGHHHHLACTKCGTIISFHETDLLSNLLHSVALQYGFKLTSHQLELHGICETCR